MRDFRVVPASTGLVVQCVACGWYAPLWGRDPAELHAEHVRTGCYEATSQPTTEETR